MNKCLAWSLQLRNDTKMSPQLMSFLFFIVTSVVYGLEGVFRVSILWQPSRC